ncbi:MAG: transcription termination/antitermination protein NusG, partial [Chloroflexi bacterium]
MIHTYTGREDQVKVNLEQRIKSMDAADKITEVVVPRVEEIEIKEG